MVVAEVMVLWVMVEVGGNGGGLVEPVVVAW